MALALATPVVVAANHGDTAAKDNVAVVPRIAAPAAAAPSGVNVTAICMATPYPSACETALSSAAARGAGSDPFAASVQFAMTRAESARALARNLSASSRPRVAPNGMDDCAELLDISLDHLHDALAAGAGDAAGVTTWLSAALTNQGTCGDSLAAVPDPAARSAVCARVAALEQFIGTALALHAKLNGGSGSSSPAPPNRAAFPSWVTMHDRHLISSPASTIAPDAVVALDGSGTHTSISDAIAAVTAPPPAHHPTASGGGAGSRKVIYVKAGRYEESVSITSKQKNVMLLGDGKGKTVISGHRSVAGGYTTYASATVGAY
uniref:Pectinesterase n=1 Tax=Oryza glumipatula TaxID=40148 RepID=A0A0D9YZC2_9ORYZ